MKKAWLAVFAIVLLALPASAQQLTRRDQVRIAVQQICPVTGQRLGAHGTPIRTRVGNETIYLCCRGCLNGKINPQHWATIHNNFFRAQGKCPVMKSNLKASAKWTVVDGQIVYVCCPPCIDQIKENPQRFLQRVEQSYVQYLGTKGKGQ